MSILVTGAAGFIGFHLSTRLLEKGYHVVGVDNLNNYYDVRLKKERLLRLKQHNNFTFYQLDLADSEKVLELFKMEKINIVVNLAAQAGVRYSLKHPQVYAHSNLVGFLNILEACRHHPVDHLLFASSSSVYGANASIPFSTKDSVDHPVSLYAATKKSNELMAHAYSHLFNMPITGLRFFTVYGPWGRPDMAYFLFTRDILEGRPIKVFNNGDMRRDFTYIDDIVEGIIGLLNHPPSTDSGWDPLDPDPSSSNSPYKIYNIGNNSPVSLIKFIKTLENAIGKQANIQLYPMQLGDVKETYADITDLHEAIGFHPKISIEEGLTEFVKWYKEYYRW
ncbi:NAD-dependent epimerase [Bacillus sp. JJ1566]|uniref:NAD-dependent epimerase n=1 Tax=Bacillus sp. JJ1566 TaxID=3122961 RepID=UPI002FFD84DD